MGDTCSCNACDAATNNGGRGGTWNDKPRNIEGIHEDSDVDSDDEYETRGAKHEFGTAKYQTDEYNLAMHHWRALSTASANHSPGMTRIMSIQLDDLVVETATPLDPVTMLPLNFVLKDGANVNAIPLATEEQLDAYATPTTLTTPIQHKNRHYKNKQKNLKTTSAIGGSGGFPDTGDSPIRGVEPPMVHTTSASTSLTAVSHSETMLSPVNETVNLTTFGGISAISSEDHSTAHETTRFLQMQEKLSTFAYSSRKIDNLRVFQFRRIALIMQNGHNYNVDSRGKRVDSVSTKPTHI